MHRLVKSKRQTCSNRCKAALRCSLLIVCGGGALYRRMLLALRDNDVQTLEQPPLEEKSAHANGRE